MKNIKTLKLVQVAILLAVLLIMSFTPLGYLKTAGLEVSLLSIPVAIGAMLVGPGAGAILGAAFGLTSFYQCFGISLFGAALLNINPFYTFIVCVPTRTLVGYLTGVIFKGLFKVDKTKTICYFAGGLLAALLNTLLFVGTLLVFFWNTEYIQSFNQTGANVIVFFALFVGIQGLVEAIVTCAAGGGVSKAVAKVVHNI